MSGDDYGLKLVEGADDDELDRIMPPAPSSPQSSEQEDPKLPKAARAVMYISELIGEMFHTPNGDTYIDVKPGLFDPLRTLRVSSRETRALLDKLMYAREGIPLGAQPRKDAIDTLDAKARHSGTVRDVDVRLAECDGAIYIDLGDETYRVIRVTAEGWNIVPRVPAPVRFRRPRGMRALPEPVSGGSLEELRRFVPAIGDGFILTVASLLSALRRRGPFPVLNIVGEQGAAKSTTARLLVSLIDPKDVPLRSPPRDERDLMIAAGNGQLVALDNISHLQPWLSDALCRVSTGGGLSSRELYTDSDEITLSATRPLILTGIEDVATRGDLADRCYLVTMPRIDDARRLTERELDAAFNEAAPRILGALLNIVVHGLAHESAVVTTGLPRMADAARWVLACEGACPWSPGDYLQAYGNVRQEMLITGISGDPVAQAVLDHLDRTGGDWTGTAGELLEILNFARGDGHAPRGWPETPRALSGRLTRAAPMLRGVGVEIDSRREGHDRRRLIDVRRVAHDRPHRPHRPPAIQDNDLAADDHADGRPRGNGQSSAPSAQPSAANSLRQNDVTDADDADGTAGLFSDEYELAERAALQEGV